MFYKMMEVSRVLANPSGKIGTRQAWLMYGIRHKINDTRGMSLLTAVLERDSKLDRFLEASVGAAEENSKIPFTFEHSQYSDGTNPMDNQMAQSLGVKKACEKMKRHFLMVTQQRLLQLQENKRIICLWELH